MVCYPYTAHGRTVHLSHSLLASRAPSISITLNALPITMVATEKLRSPGSPPRPPLALRLYYNVHASSRKAFFYSFELSV